MKKNMISRWMKSVETNKLCCVMSVCFFLLLTIAFFYISLHSGKSKAEAERYESIGLCCGICMVCLICVRGAFRSRFIGPQNDLKTLFYLIKKPVWYRNFCWISFYIFLLIAIAYVIRIICL